MCSACEIEVSLRFQLIIFNANRRKKQKKPKKPKKKKQRVPFRSVYLHLEGYKLAGWQCQPI